MSGRLALVDGARSVAVPICCSTCGQPTEGLALLTVLDDGSALLTIRDEQIQIRDNHCKGATP